MAVNKLFLLSMTALSGMAFGNQANAQDKQVKPPSRQEIRVRCNGNKPSNVQITFGRMNPRNDPSVTILALREAFSENSADNLLVLNAGIAASDSVTQNGTDMGFVTNANTRTKKFKHEMLRDNSNAFEAYELFCDHSKKVCEANPEGLLVRPLTSREVSAAEHIKTAVNVFYISH